MLLNTAALFFYPSPKYRRILVVLEGPKAWFMVLTNNLCSSMYTNGDSIRNVTILARVDSETGRTIWAKQFNITLISIPYLNVKYPRIDSNDNIYTVLTYRNMDSFESVLVIYDKDGQAQKMILLANTNSDGSYSLVYLEVQDFKIIQMQKQTGKIF